MPLNRRKRKRLRCVRQVRTVARKRSRLRWCAFIGSLTDFLPATAFFTTTSRRGAGKILLPARLRERRRGSRAGWMIELVLGNLESKRDWGRAQDYVQAMWLMLQHEKPDDYVVATGETHSVREFVEAAFAVVDLPWKKYVKQDAAFDRPIEPSRLVGCADKIRKTLKWQPSGTFQDLVREMVQAEVEMVRG